MSRITEKKQIPRMQNKGTLFLLILKLKYQLSKFLSLKYKLKFYLRLDTRSNAIKNSNST